MAGLYGTVKRLVPSASRLAYVVDAGSLLAKPSVITKAALLWQAAMIGADVSVRLNWKPAYSRASRVGVPPDPFTR